MRKMGAILLLVAAAVVALAQGTPEDTIRAFVAAWNNRDLESLASHVNGGRTRDPMLQALKNEKQWPVITIVSISSKVTGNNATAKTVSTMTGTPNVPKGPQTENVTLSKIGGKWLIIAPDGEVGREAVVVALAQVVSGPAVFERAKTAAQATACLSNLKQLALGIMMFAADNDDRLALTPNNWKAKVMPYLKNESLFQCPLAKGAGIAYSVNPALVGKKLSTIKRPSETIMVYEGKGGKPTYRHDGKAAIGFADGSCRRLDAKAVARLRWNP